MSDREQRIFAFLNRKYTQRADSRQQSMGLQYMTAETHDLAREIDRLFGLLVREQQEAPNA